MRQPKVAQRYAKALFDLAVERGEVERIKEDLEGIKALDHGELRAVWMSPVIQGRKNRKCFPPCWKGKYPPPPLLFSTFFSKKAVKLLSMRSPMHLW